MRGAARVHPGTVAAPVKAAARGPWTAKLQAHAGPVAAGTAAAAVQGAGVSAARGAAGAAAVSGAGVSAAAAAAASTVAAEFRALLLAPVVPLAASQRGSPPFGTGAACTTT